MTVPWNAWDLAEEKVREALFAVSGLIDDDELAGAVFVAGLLVTDRIFSLAKAAVLR